MPIVSLYQSQSVASLNLSFKPAFRFDRAAAYKGSSYFLCEVTRDSKTRCRNFPLTVWSSKAFLWACEFLSRARKFFPGSYEGKWNLCSRKEGSYGIERQRESCLLFSSAFTKSIACITHPVFNRDSAVVLNTDASPLTTYYFSVTTITKLRKYFVIPYYKNKKYLEFTYKITQNKTQWSNRILFLTW